MDIISRVERSWRLTKAATAVLNEDGELMLLPILSGVCTVAAGGLFAWYAHATGLFDALQEGRTPENYDALTLWTFAFYLVHYAILTFFNTALVSAALERLNGGDPTVRSALGVAVRRIIPILGYAAVAATVGMILRALAERGGIIGKLIGAGAGIAWAVVTFLVVPVIANENLGPLAAIERSRELLGRTWGENIIGSVGIALVLGVVSAIIAFAGIAPAMLLIQSGHETIGVPLFIVTIAAFLGLTAFASALSGVYSAAVYWYAVAGEPPAGFDRELVRGAFSPKGA